MLREVESRNVFGTLQTQQRELLVLAELSGLQADPAIYRSVECLNIYFIYLIICYYIITRIIIELLNQQIDPDAIYKLLKYIRRTSKAGKQTSTTAIKKNN